MTAIVVIVPLGLLVRRLWPAAAAAPGLAA
jgi:hypothetical protein